MPSGPSARSDMEIELSKLSSPRIFLVRMLVFLVLCSLVMVVLYKQIVIRPVRSPPRIAAIGASSVGRCAIAMPGSAMRKLLTHDTSG